MITEKLITSLMLQVVAAYVREIITHDQACEAIEAIDFLYYDR